MTRISETQLMLTTIYPTGRQDGTHSATLGGIPYTMNVVSGIATTTATFLAADGPTSINGIALAARQNFTLTNLEITAIPEPGTLAMLALGLGALIHFRRRRQ
ncbi:MAG: PEP-CTERM sorting domain-containing protein [Verrucomicrobia bacterium]|nr:PEP-CTERM sorting domain-containing protein [Verrucomicrobiota bacterium]MCH8527367.1 PEP-CTERM sorting domain-containing protein [Kiritimatiellia bacterium]